MTMIDNKPTADKPSLTVRPRNTGVTEKKLSIDSTKPLITINVFDYAEVPQIIYKGKELKNKTAIKFEWKTKTDNVNDGKLEYEMEYLQESDDRFLEIKNVQYKRDY
jgi:hypothetical protein